MKVRDTARLHEETVSKADEHAKRHAKKKPRAKARKSTLGEMTEVKVDDRVMEAAKAAIREGEKLKIVASDEVWTVPR